MRCRAAPPTRCSAGRRWAGEAAPGRRSTVPRLARTAGLNKPATGSIPAGRVRPPNPRRRQRPMPRRCSAATAGSTARPSRWGRGRSGPRRGRRCPAATTPFGPSAGRGRSRALGEWRPRRPARGAEPSCCGARRPERRSPRPTGGARWASGGSAPFLSHQENRKGRARRLRHVVRIPRRSRVGAGRLRPNLHASLQQVRKGTTGCSTDRASRLGNLLQRP